MRHRAVTAAAVIATLLGVLAGCGAGSQQPPAAPEAAPLVVGYLTAWGSGDRIKDVERSGAADVLTHLVYAFGSVAGGRCAGGQEAVFAELRDLKARHPKLKLIWSFGGWNGSAGFTEAAKDPAAFAASCRDLVDDPRWTGVFDGIDIDWEYPNACGRSCDHSGPDALAALTEALRAAFGPDRLVTAAVTGESGTAGKADYARAVRSLDWAMVMSYDYFGTGSPRGPTAAHSPLTAYPGIPRTSSTAEAAVAAYTGMGIPARKLLLGIGFYGRGWTGVAQPEPGAAATGLPKPRDYRVLRETCPPTGTVGGTAYAQCGDEWWAYDTPETINTKMAYAREAGLGGAFAWELAGDSADGQLIKAMAAGLA
ncbi:chitinase [Asanoa ferruginea]|uniref:chitinase n=1 Tax=Asanoa ferruginea TaxID=53367 RepID=A0A3D9ZVI6_9ACTN|nr:glycoside hydrolase family 18 protein [Asanoa ferruginea]REG01216.1 chitinase [Asanoa ferruginea]GIF47074.1 chitinase [Asanoa ferruginea]